MKSADHVSQLQAEINSLKAEKVKMQTEIKSLKAENAFLKRQHRQQQTSPGRADVHTSKSGSNVHASPTHFRSQGPPRPPPAGFLFLCNNVTFKECIDRKLFGLPTKDMQSMRTIGPSTKLFLYNTQANVLHGCFQCACQAELNLEPGAWTPNGKGKTRFAAQIRVMDRGGAFTRYPAANIRCQVSSDNCVLLGIV